MKKILTAALIASAAIPAMATDYFLVVPVKNKQAASAIQVALTAATLPEAQVGVQFAYDFRSNLVVSGDANFDQAGVVWGVGAGSLPAGLAIDSKSGVLAGTPTGAGASSFSVSAAYKDKTGQQDYQLLVAGASRFAAVGSVLADRMISAPSLGVAATPAVINLKNSGTGTGTLSVPGFEGAGASQFNASSTCTNVPVSGTCAVSVTWLPTTPNAEATLMLAGAAYKFTGSLANYATWDPANAGAGYVLSNNNLTVSNSGISTGVRATAGRSTGKWYWEVTLGSGDVTETIGIVKSTLSMKTASGCFGCQAGYDAPNNFRVVYPHSGAQTLWTAATTSNFTGTRFPGAIGAVGDTYGFALDVDAQTLTVYYAPVGGACVDHSILQFARIGAATWYPVISTGGLSWSATANFGSFAFKCPAPPGYQLLQ